MKTAIALITAALLSASALAAPAEGAPVGECEGVQVATGPKGKGYSLLFADIKKLCGTKVNLCEVNTTGGLDNLNNLSTKEADVGFAQLDTYNDMKVGDENIAGLQGVAGLNYNYLHIVAATAGYNVTAEKRMAGIKYGSDTQAIVITRFNDLRGKTVALVGSAQLLGRRLDKQLGLGMQFKDVKDDASAFELVKKGQVAAAFTVSGWPSGAVKTLTPDSGLTLVPFDGMVGDPYKIKSLNYKNLAVYNVNSLGIPNVLFTRQFTGARANNIAALQSCIAANLGEFKEGNYQPAWNEVKPGDVSGVPMFKKSGK